MLYEMIYSRLSLWSFDAGTEVKQPVLVSERLRLSPDSRNNGEETARQLLLVDDSQPVQSAPSQLDQFPAEWGYESTSERRAAGSRGCGGSLSPQRCTGSRVRNTFRQERQVSLPSRP